jgi:hypothetical protein
MSTNDPAPPTSAPGEDETWMDERGVTWARPTAWAYAMVCKARDAALARAASCEQDAARWRKLMELGTLYHDGPGFICDFQRARIWFHECRDFEHTMLVEYIDAALASAGQASALARSQPKGE